MGHLLVCGKVEVEVNHKMGGLSIGARVRREEDIFVWF